MTMPRCAVRLDDKAGGARATGLAFVAGRDDRHAELAALFDALLQIPRQTEALDSAVIQPIEARLEPELRAAAGEGAAPRVPLLPHPRAPTLCAAPPPPAPAPAPPPSP